MRFLWIFIIYIYIHTTHEAVVAQWNSATVNATVLDLIPFLVEEERGSTTQQAMSLKSDGVSWYSSVLCLPFTNVVGSILTPSWLHLNNIFFPWVFKPEYFFTFTLSPRKRFFYWSVHGEQSVFNNRFPLPTLLILYIVYYKTLVYYHKI